MDYEVTFFDILSTKAKQYGFTMRLINEKHHSTVKEACELAETLGVSNLVLWHTGIPVRTLEDWEAARRTPPEYIPRLIAYQLKYEELVYKFNRIEFEAVKNETG